MWAVAHQHLLRNLFATLLHALHGTTPPLTTTPHMHNHYNPSHPILSCRKLFYPLPCLTPPSTPTPGLSLVRRFAKTTLSLSPSLYSFASFNLSISFVLLWFWCSASCALSLATTAAAVAIKWY